MPTRLKPFSFLSDALYGDKQLVIIDGDAVVSKPLLSDASALSPCCHEEPDSCMMLQAAHTAQLLQDSHSHL